jgi:hypothetical protein
MQCIVTAAMTEVDPANKSDIGCSPFPTADDNQLLVMGAAEPYALVEKNLASCLVHHHAKVAVLFGAESKPVRVGSPKQRLDADSTTSRGGEDRSDLRLKAVTKTLVGIASPVGEKHLVAGPQLVDLLQQAAEVRRSVNQGLDRVAGGPGLPRRMTPVKLGELVAPFRGSEQPALQGAAGWLLLSHRETD